MLDRARRASMCCGAKVTTFWYADSPSSNRFVSTCPRRNDERIFSLLSPLYQNNRTYQAFTVFEPDHGFPISSGGHQLLHEGQSLLPTAVGHVSLAQVKKEISEGLWVFGQKLLFNFYAEMLSLQKKLDLGHTTPVAAYI